MFGVGGIAHCVVVIAAVVTAVGFDGGREGGEDRVVVARGTIDG